MPKITEGQFALGGLAFIVVWLLVVLPLLHRPAQQTPKVYAQQETHGALKGEKNAKGSPQPSAQANEEHGGNHPEQGEDQGTEFWPPFLGIKLKITDSLLALFTAGLLIFTGLLWHSTDKLWAAGVRQAELTQAALIADQRAWIMVSLEIESFRFGPVIDGAADAEVELIFRIRNVGRTPALNATLSYALIGNFSTSTIVIREFAEAHNMVSEYDGRLVSPGEDYTEEPPTAKVLGSELYQYGRNGLVTPLVVGCVTYHILQDGLPHQTAFAYRIEKWGEDDPRIFVGAPDFDANDLVANVAPGGLIT